MNLIELINQLENIRGIPQFLFSEGIQPSSMIRVRREIIDYKKENPDQEEIDFIIHSPGGSPDDAYRIIRTLRNNFKRVNVIIPFWAKSAATLLSLGATTIYMSEFGEFGPIDIQIAREREDSPDIDRESALNDEFSLRRIEARSRELFQSMFINLYSDENFKINKNELSKQLFEYLSKFYTPLLEQINPYKLGEKKRKLEIGEMYAKRILIEYNDSVKEEQRNQLVDFLINGCPDHGYIVDYNLISLILPNVINTTNFDKEYNLVIEEIVTIFLNSEELRFVGFVKQIEDTDETKTVEKKPLNKNGKKPKKTKADGK